MSLRKSAQERRDEKEYNERRLAWHREMSRRGLTVVGTQSYNAMSDVVSNLYLALRRFDNPYLHPELQARIRAVYEEARAMRDKTVSYAAFDTENWQPPDDGKVLYLPKTKEQG